VEVKSTAHIDSLGIFPLSIKNLPMAKRRNGFGGVEGAAEEGSAENRVGLGVKNHFDTKGRYNSQIKILKQRKISGIFRLHGRAAAEPCDHQAPA
jgi:hypothetical protein